MPTKLIFRRRCRRCGTSVESELRRARSPRRRRGAIVVLVALLLTVFVGTAAFSVDIAYMQLVRVQLRAASDAAANAAVEAMGRTKSSSAGQSIAIQVAASNRVAGAPLVLKPADIVFGKGALQKDGTVKFTAGSTPYNAARVTAKRMNGSSSGAVPLFFARAFNVDNFQTQRIATATRWDRDIALVVDRSGSMTFDNKSTGLQTAVNLFLDIIRDHGFNDQVGLASYNHVPTLDQALTTNTTLTRNKVNTMVFSGQTNIGGGIVTGIQVLNGTNARSNVEKTMVLMTDGRHNTGFDPIAAARNAAALGIVIHTINFGADADEARMLTIAEMTGGTYHHAPDNAALLEIYRNIALMFGTMLTE